MICVRLAVQGVAVRPDPHVEPIADDLAAGELAVLIGPGKARFRHVPTLLDVLGNRPDGDRCSGQGTAVGVEHPAQQRGGIVGGRSTEQGQQGDRGTDEA